MHAQKTVRFEIENLPSIESLSHHCCVQTGIRRV